MYSTKTNGKFREDLRLAFEIENIEYRPLWKPIYEKYPNYRNKIAETLFENALCLPSGSNLHSEDRLRIKMF